MRSEEHSGTTLRVVNRTREYRQHGNRTLRTIDQHLSEANELASVTALRNEGDSLLITWSDGAVHRLPWSILRKACPCASCRTERAQPPAPAPLLPVLKPEEAQPLHPKAMRPVGNYAYGIEFSDGHASGIYSLEYLRELGEASVG